MTTLEYIIREPKNKLDKNPLLLLLHGYGSNEQDLFSFAEELPCEYYIISLRAPYTLDFGAYAWYAIEINASGAKFSDDIQAKASKELISQMIDQLVEKYPIDKNNINLVGFSQGAILSYGLALTYPEKINKVVALSGYFNQNILEEDFKQKSLNNLKFFVSHGISDQIIPVEAARKTPEILKDLDIECIYKEYPVGHGVAPQNFYDFKTFLKK